MHDRSLEQTLQAALRAEGDGLPLTITAEELERRLALRRRGGFGRLTSLGLAAAVGVGLLGLAAVVGGWFDPRPAVVPIASPSPTVAQASPDPSRAPSGPLGLPSLDDLLADVDPARVVRAEAVGPSADFGDQNAENARPILPGSVTFDPVAASGSYDVLAVCAGDGHVVLSVVRGDGQSSEDVPITCDGGRSMRQMGLEAGSALRVTSDGPGGWRVVLIAPDRPAPHAAAIDLTEIDGATSDVALGNQSTTESPSYAAVQIGGGTRTRMAVGAVGSRTRYDVYVTCAGPSPIRYSFGGTRPDDAPVAPGAAVDFVAGEVECDGTLQHDIVDIPFGGSDVFVTAEERTAWRIVVTTAKPPIAIPADGGGWTHSTSIGPDYRLDGDVQLFGLIGPDHDGALRVVISCSGQTNLTGTIDADGETAAAHRPEPFTLDCSGRTGDATLIRTYAHAGNTVDVATDRHGVAAWIVVTTQVRSSPTPAP